MFQKLKSVVVFLKIIVTFYLIVKCFKKLFFEKNIGSVGSADSGGSTGSAVCNPQFSNTPVHDRLELLIS